jgi:flavin reductase (DIM6/NTAB) family NADH-FMN oxidoreductase RutF
MPGMSEEPSRRRVIMDRRAKDHALQSFPYGLFVVGSTEGDMGLTIVANWGTQVSFRPSLLAISIEYDSRMCAAIENSGAFSINLLPSKGIRVARMFIKPRETPKSDYEEHLLSGSKRGLPFLKDAVACMECRVVASYRTGDHVLFVGEVTDAEYRGGGDALTLRETGWRYHR